MSEAMIIALVDFAVKFGIPAATVFFQNISKAASIDDAIAALSAAHDKSLADYIAEYKANDPVAAARIKASQGLAT